MKITSLIAKNHRVQVFVDEEYAFSCTENFVIDNRLYVGLELSDKEFEGLRKQAQYSIVELKMFEYAMRWRYSEKELREKVTRYCMKRFSFRPEEEFFDNSFAKLVRLNLFNSKKIVENLVRLYLSKSKGKSFIYSKLVSKGFDRQEIQEELELVDSKKLDQTLNGLLAKKYNSFYKDKNMDKYKIRQKLLRFAISRGFGIKEINDTLKEIEGSKDQSSN